MHMTLIGKDEKGPVVMKLSGVELMLMQCLHVALISVQCHFDAC